MTFILVSLKDDTTDVQIANRLWIPIAEEIQRSGLLHPERAETIAFNLCTKISSIEADVIGRHFGELLKHDALPASIDREIVQMFIDFTASSFGFEVC
ncbi:MAG: hypothetical protein ACSHWS_05590 [Sulfitobacter sp.]